MNTKETLNALAWAALAFVGVWLIAPRLLPMPSPPDHAKVSPDGSGAGAPFSANANQSSGHSGPESTASPVKTSTGAAAPTSSAQMAAERQEAARWTLHGAEALETVVLGQFEPSPEGAAPPRFRIEATISNRGASLQDAWLPDFHETVRGNEPYHLVAPLPLPNGAVLRSLCLERILVDEVELNLADSYWRLIKKSDAESERAILTLELLKDGVPTIRLTREYHLPAQPVETHRSDLFVELRVENLAEEPHRVILKFDGPVGIPQDDARMDHRAVDLGLRSGEEVHMKRHTFPKLASQAGKRNDLYKASQSPNDSLSWVAVNNQFFTFTLAAGNDEGQPSFINEVRAVDVDQQSQTASDQALYFITKSLELPAASRAAPLTLPLELYVGAKSRPAFLRVEPYTSRNYYQQIAQGYGWCTFVWLVELMMWLLDGMHAVIGDYGIALIVLVLLVRTLLHPITKFGQVNMVRIQKKMAMLGPKMEEVKKKYANDPMRRNTETTKLFKQEGVNPASNMVGCLPMFLQLPIWAALYMSLGNNIQMRHQPFAWFWPADLTAPDELIRFSAPVHLWLLGTLHSFNLLPFILAIAMYWQQKTMPKPPEMPNQTEQQKQQAEMMKMMMPMTSIMMLFIFYNAPSGLTIYIMASSFFGAIEQRRIRKHIDEQEKRGVFDLPKPTRQPSTSSPSAHEPRKEGWWTRLQRLAEDARKQQNPRAGKPGRRG